VNALRKALAGAVVLGLGVAGCSAASHLKALKPQVSSPPSTLALHTVVHVPKPKFQLGAGIDLYTYKGQNFTESSLPELAYLKALHANSVMVSFPFFMHGERAIRVYHKTSTPTPAQLAEFSRAAAQQGLYVTLRPLLDEGSLGEPRNIWKPRRIRRWFASYRHFLMPYARMAQRVGVPRLYVGAEFQFFGTSPLWNRLDRALRRVYKGTLVYSNNGHKIHRGSGGRGVQISADSYPDMPHMGPRASVAKLTRAWEAWDRIMPPGTVLSEVGIAAVRGAYAKPWVHDWPNPQISTITQVRWFTAACHAAAATHMGGIYFWAIGFGKAELSTAPNPKNQGAWEQGPGARAAAACFKQLSSG
jgi:hypothetical protein